MRPTLPFVLLFALACGAPQSERLDPPVADPDLPPQGPSAPESRAASGVIPMSPSCTEGVDERCDAVDQDCDGHIDEGCGYETGALQITMAWNTDADVDLVITNPEGVAVTGDGALDREARGACGEPTRDRIENARWAEPPPSGLYRVAVRHASECERGAATTTATVSVSAAGGVLGVYNVSLEPGQTAPVAEISMP